MSPQSEQAGYREKSRKLVIAFDVGTTFSGVSYSILDPGQVPKISSVTRFPGLKDIGGAAKIPTIIYYDKSGVVKAVGAEATRDTLLERIEDEGWVKAEWFKLHMRPESLSSSDALKDIPPLPAGKSIIDIMADYIRYLYSCTRTYIEESNTQKWSSFKDNIDFVLGHPNGWEGAQQHQMRRAVVQAGLVPDTDAGHARIRFVTEGEASLHYCIRQGYATEALKDGVGTVIVDAGGGTIDLSAYGMAQEGSFEEITASQCYMQGSVYVTIRVKSFLQKFLQGSKFSLDVDDMVNDFDQRGKLTFDGREAVFAKFRNARDRDPKLKIRSGQISLSKEEVGKCFEPSISCVVHAVKTLCMKAKRPISSVLLVGGFSASDHLFKELKNALEGPLKLNIYRPDSYLNKAVADGAVSFYLDHYVSKRVSKYAIGTTCSVFFRIWDPEHRAHVDADSESAFIGADGTPRLAGKFDVILPKDVQVAETREFRQTYGRQAKKRDPLRHVTTSIMCYRGGGTTPTWIEPKNSDQFSTLCTIEADTSKIVESLEPSLELSPLTGLTVCYEMNYDIVLSFGLTELKAQLAWEEDGAEKRSPAKIIYDNA